MIETNQTRIEVFYKVIYEDNELAFLITDLHNRCYISPGAIASAQEIAMLDMSKSMSMGLSTRQYAVLDNYKLGISYKVFRLTDAEKRAFAVAWIKE